MQRRRFLKFLGVGAATAVSAAMIEEANAKSRAGPRTYKSGQALTIGEDGRWRPADCQHDKMVYGLSTEDEVVTTPGSACRLQFDEHGPGSAHVGDNVYLSHDGRVSLHTPMKSGVMVVMVGILMDAKGTVLFHPQFISRRP